MADGGGGGGDIPSIPDAIAISLALNLRCLTDCQKLWYNCSLFVNTYFDTDKVTSHLMALP